MFKTVRTVYFEKFPYIKCWGLSKSISRQNFIDIKRFRTLNVEVYLLLSGLCKLSQPRFRTLNVEVYQDKYRMKKERRKSFRTLNVEVYHELATLNIEN